MRICSLYILQTLISREKGRADIENEYPIQLRICVQFSVHFPDPKRVFFKITSEKDRLILP